jgi:hypothetical protein
LFFGEGDVAPIAHEVLRRAVPDPKRRPVIHVTWWALSEVRELHSNIKSLWRLAAEPS